VSIDSIHLKFFLTVAFFIICCILLLISFSHSPSLFYWTVSGSFCFGALIYLFFLRIGILFICSVSTADIISFRSTTICLLSGPCPCSQISMPPPIGIPSICSVSTDDVISSMLGCRRPQLNELHGSSLIASQLSMPLPLPRTAIRSAVSLARGPYLFVQFVCFIILSILSIDPFCSSGSLLFLPVRSSILFRASLLEALILHCSAILFCIHII
jgi:hypothetical protein